MNKNLLNLKLQEIQSDFRKNVSTQFTETDSTTKATYADLFIMGRFVETALDDFRKTILDCFDN